MILFEPATPKALGYVVDNLSAISRHEFTDADLGELADRMAAGPAIMLRQRGRPLAIVGHVPKP